MPKISKVSLFNYLRFHSHLKNLLWLSLIESFCLEFEFILFLWCRIENKVDSVLWANLNFYVLILNYKIFRI